MNQKEPSSDFAAWALDRRNNLPRRRLMAIEFSIHEPEIRAALSTGATIKIAWQYAREKLGFSGSYNAFRRYVARLREPSAASAQTVEVEAKKSAGPIMAGSDRGLGFGTKWNPTPDVEALVGPRKK